MKADTTTHFRSAKAEAVTIALIALGVFAFSKYFGGHEILEKRLEALGISSEIITVFVILALALALFSFRRWRELKKHVAARVQQEEDRRHAEETILHQALHDSLTDLPNRHLLQDRMQQAILAGQRENKSVAVLLLDLDRFNEVNDTLGHQTGDVILKQLGVRLRSLLRSTDTVARLGGDEFAVLLWPASAEEALQVARKIVHIIDRPFGTDDIVLSMACSIGIALFPDHGQDAHTLLTHADSALYRAKEAGDTCTVYSAKEDTHSLQRLALIGQLRHSIENKGLNVVYQPKINLRTGEVMGVESLARWNHADLGSIPPDQFIVLAERTGLIGGLTRFVLESALAQMKEWQDLGMEIPVAVNLSSRILHDSRFPASVAHMLETSGMPARLLEFEITETAIMLDPKGALRILKELNETGIRLSIDDFGTGYSSLAHLRRLPVETIKIDKSFVMGMSASEEDATIVRSTIDLAHNLSMQVIAEGVETKEHWDSLKRLGCDAAQGYYVSRPIPAQEFNNWYKSFCLQDRARE